MRFGKYYTDDHRRTRHLQKYLKPEWTKLESDVAEVEVNPQLSACRCLQLTRIHQAAGALFGLRSRSRNVYGTHSSTEAAMFFFGTEFSELCNYMDYEPSWIKKLIVQLYGKFNMPVKVPVKFQRLRPDSVCEYVTKWEWKTVHDILVID